METKSINVNNTSKDSFLKTQVECSLHSPINKITWSNNKNIIKCSHKYPFTEKNIETISGPNKGYPWNEYLHMYFNNGVNADCNNKPLLGMKFITNSNGKYSIEYKCSNDDTTIFSQVKNYQYKDLKKSSYSSTESDISIQNNNFIDNDWLQNTQKVYTCPNNWFLSKIGGSTRYEGTLVYNNYDWTCGTFYNDYKNPDGAVFQWRYYKEDEDIYIQVLTNAMITTMFNDDSLQDFAGSTIYFDIRYNITKNVVSVMYKIEYGGDDSPYVDGTTYCHIENKSNSIEINFPLTELSIIQIIFTKGDFTIFDDTTAELNKLPLCFSKMTIVQDTNLPKIFTIMYIFVSITIYLLPINYVYNETIIYSEGLAVRFTYLIAILSIILIIISSIKNYKNLLSKKYVPMFVFLTFGTLALMLQILNPELFLVSPLEVLVTITMYFTIENPDVKLLKEMHDAKVISDNANEEKTLFLYNMTQEIRETTKNINVEADNILESKDLELDKDSARNIKGETSKFTTMTNDILDVSTIDSSNIKIYNTKYNIKTILKEVVSNYKTISMNKGIEFRSNIEHNIPDILYGDSIGLKKVLTLLLKESIKNTNKGYIEFNVNTIIKKDIIRLIITIEDSGIGIKANELESVKINNKNISESYKTITLMNGTMILSSNYGMGTKISIILDQKIEEKVTKELTMYKNTYDNKSILVVDDNESTHKLIEKLLKDSNINIDYSLNGKDTLNKIKSKNKYALILIDEELSQITGAELLIKLKEIRNFNTPVILLTKDNNYEYSEEYLKQGFTSVIIKPLKKDNLLQVIDKFSK